MSRRGFANVVLILVVTILVGIAGYFAFIRKPGLSAVPQASQQTGQATSSQASPEASAQASSIAKSLQNATENPARLTVGDLIGTFTVNVARAKNPEKPLSSNNVHLELGGEGVLRGSYQFNESLGGLTNFYYSVGDSRYGFTFRESTRDEMALVQQLHAPKTGIDRIGSRGSATIIVKDLVYDNSGTDVSYWATLVKVVERQPLAKNSIHMELLKFASNFCDQVRHNEWCDRSASNQSFLKRL